MPRLSNVEKVNSNSFESAENRSLTSEVPHIHEEENGIQFFEGKCTVRVANQLELRQKAYEMIYKLYSSMGYTQKTDDGLKLSIYDALPETTTFVAEDDQGFIEGTLTVVFDSPLGLPAEELYKKEIDQLRNAGGQIREFVSFGINNKGKNSLKYLAGLFYCAFLHAWQRDHSTVLVITVNPRHENFYCRKLFFEKIGPERNYSKVNGAPAVFLCLSLMEISRLRHKMRIFPFSMLNYSNQEELDFANKIQNLICHMSDEEFFTFFIEETDMWAKASTQQKEFIKKVYPSNKVNHNEVSRALARAFSKKNRSSDVIRKNSAKIAQQ